MPNPVRAQSGPTSIENSSVEDRASKIGVDDAELADLANDKVQVVFFTANFCREGRAIQILRQLGQLGRLRGATTTELAPSTPDIRLFVAKMTQNGTL
jgi:hypothetical protein